MVAARIVRSGSRFVALMPADGAPVRWPHSLGQIAANATAGTSGGHTAAASSSSSMLPFPPARRQLSTSSAAALYPTSPVLCPDPGAAAPSPSSPPPSAPPSDGDTATSKAERTRRRFWKKVDVGYHDKPAPHLVVRLDGRNLKTPSGAVLAIPADRPLLASLIAREWAEQDRLIRTHSLPMTSLAARAIDGLETPAEREGVCDELIKYLDTETICFHETHPRILVELQKERWDPILAWTAERFGTPPVRTFEGVFGVEQDPEVIRVLREYIGTFNGWDLAAFERVVRTSKSFLVALRLVDAVRMGRDNEFGVDAAAQAADVEVESQTHRWGQVEDTHDVDHADLRKTLASTACALVRDDAAMAQAVTGEYTNQGR